MNETTIAERIRLNEEREANLLKRESTFLVHYVDAAKKREHGETTYFAVPDKDWILIFNRWRWLFQQGDELAERVYPMPENHVLLK